MPSAVSVTAMVTPFPGSLRPPRPEPGEGMLGFVIRHHRDEWANFVEAETREGTTTPSQLSAVANGAVDPNELATTLRERLSEFMNMRLPSHWRTTKCLAELREHLQEPLSQIVDYGFELTQILSPRERLPSTDARSRTRSEQLATLEALGAEIVLVETGLAGEIGLAQHLMRVKGHILWLVAGATHFLAPLAALTLKQAIGQFRSQPQLALYTDGAYSFLYRTSALNHLVDDGALLTNDVNHHARLLQAAGFRCGRAPSLDYVLSHLEPLYGGEVAAYETRERPSAPSRPGLFRRLLGRD
jgi:hypothetical protein